MLIDLHAHSSGISKCCRIPAEEVLRVAQEHGIDGIVLTNHYVKTYVRDGDYAAFAKRYVTEYRYAKELGDACGLRVLFGIELTVAWDPKVHVLIYGVEESFLERYPTLFDLSQQELYELVKANGGVVVQAHPYRGGNRLLDTAYLDGIEISCHPLYEGTYLQELTAVAKTHGLLLTCGGDFHADTHRPHCGMYLPDSIQTGVELGAYLASANEVTLCVQEVDETTSHDVVYTRPLPKSNPYLFDFDGTLVDSMPAFAALMLRILDEHGISYGSDIVKIITPLGYRGTAEYFQTLGIEKSVEELMEIMHRYAKEEYELRIPAKKTVADTLRAMKAAGISLNVLTASPHTVLDPCLKRLGLWELFDHVWSCDDFGTTKADPQIYVHAAERLGCAVGEVIFVDDNAGAVKTAKRAGMKAVGIYDDSSADYVEEMKAISHRYVYTLAELLQDG